MILVWSQNHVIYMLYPSAYFHFLYLYLRGCCLFFQMPIPLLFLVSFNALKYITLFILGSFYLMHGSGPSSVFVCWFLLLSSTPCIGWCAHSLSCMFDFILLLCQFLHIPKLIPPLSTRVIIFIS